MARGYLAAFAAPGARVGQAADGQLRQPGLLGSGWSGHHDLDLLEGPVRLHSRAGENPFAILGRCPDRAKQGWPTMPQVFVYGSLLSGLRFHDMLAGARFLGTDCTQPHFTLRDLGAYPGAQSGGHTALAGELYAVDDAHLTDLDEFEDCPRHYLRQPIELASGRRAWIYVLRSWPGLSQCPVVASGSWRDWLDSRNR